MAGRGAGIIVELLQGNDKEQISLPVGLHTPLHHLRQQLEEITSIPVPQQVLILCDLTDKERNNDRVLTASESFLSLRDCGIRNGSTLTLHALGSIDTEARSRILRDADARAKAEVVLKESSKKKIYSLATDVPASQANHSFAGVIFDIHVKGPYEVEIASFGIGGMLGRVRIYARDKSWEAGPNPQDPQESLGWKKIADCICRPNWDKHYEVQLNVPFKLLPHSVHGFYLHSSLPGDLGIQYQSYPKNTRVAESEHIFLTPGIGHACRHDVSSCIPFDREDSWYRSYRCLAGTVSYKANLKAWSPFEHQIFPKTVHAGVKAMLLCQLRPWSQTHAHLSLLSDKFIIYNILEFCHWDWFILEEVEEESSEDEEEEERGVLRTMRGGFAGGGGGFDGMEGFLQQFLAQINGGHGPFLGDDDDEEDDDYFDAEEDDDDDDDEPEDEEEEEEEEEET